MTANELLEQLNGVVAEAKDRLPATSNLQELADLRRSYLGKKGKVQLVLKGMRGVEPEQRREVGASANQVKTSLDDLFTQRKTELEDEALAAELSSHYVDWTAPGRDAQAGGRHPIISTMREMELIFRRMGFDVATGPQVEHDFYNFESLNFPHDHPARDMQDTLMVEGGRLLRTHTSPVQIRSMLAYEPPIRVIAPGAVYRRDDDITHSPMFFQVEGLHVDKGVHLGQLKGVLTHFARELFGSKTPVRMRPSFFPFTEPSVEVDIGCIFCKSEGCRVCSHTGWLEILGAGMVDPNVLRSCDVDPEIYTGWAFGVGVERVAMLRHKIANIRVLYESDVRFLGQFSAEY